MFGGPRQAWRLHPRRAELPTSPPLWGSEFGTGLGNSTVFAKGKRSVTWLLGPGWRVGRGAGGRGTGGVVLTDF